MARVSLIDEHQHPELRDVIDRIRGARRGKLLNIYRLMLHTPEVAAAWFELNSALRFKTRLDGKTRELAILLVAMLNGVDYVFRAHASSYALQEGLSVDQIQAFADWRASEHFDIRQRALLAYVEAMTRDVTVGDEIYDALRQHYSDREIVELTVLIGAYNMLTRVLQALRVDPELT
jgi:4-carboxymuconolactone decarboxylase